MRILIIIIIDRFAVNRLCTIGLRIRISLMVRRFTVKPVTISHPLGPEKTIFSGRWSLVRGLHRTTIMNVRPSVPGEVVSVVPGWSLVTVVFSYRFYCSTRLVASHGGL